MLESSAKKLQYYKNFVFRCVTVGPDKAYGIIEGLAGVYAECTLDTTNTKSCKGQVYRLKKGTKWVNIPSAGLQEGKRYLVTKRHIQKNRILVRPYGLLPGKDFTFPEYKESVLDDRVEEVAEELQLNQVNRRILEVFQKAYGICYKRDNYGLSIRTLRSEWRYEYTDHCLLHRGSWLTKDIMRINIKGWHLQDTNDCLRDVMDAVCYIVTHDYGIKSVGMYRSSCRLSA